MSFFANPSNLTSLALLVGALGYCYEKFMAGRRKVKTEASDQTVENTRLIENLQRQLDAQDKLAEKKEAAMIEERSAYHKEMGEMKNALGRMQGTLEEKEKRIGDYERIFKGYNPKIEESLGLLAQFMGDLKPVMEKIVTHLDGEVMKP